MAGIFNASIFNNAIFNTDGTAEAVKTGGKGDNPKKRIFKPTGLDFRKAKKIVEQVAARQHEELHLDEQKKFDELYYELALENIEFESRYLDMLNQRAEQLMRDEIGRLIREQQDNDTLTRMLIMAAAI